MSDGTSFPVASIEYKPAQKLPLSQIIASLKEKIRPAEEVINKESDDLDFLSRSLVVAVITQLFSIQSHVQMKITFSGIDTSDLILHSRL